MPNLGGKNQRKKKKTQVEDREVRFKEESEEYAQITKILGDGRFQCKCADGVDRIAHVRGKLRKRTWLANGDIILVSIREFEPEKCDIVEKYKEKEVAKLKKQGEIPDSMVLPKSSEEDEKEIQSDIKFEEEEVVIEKKKENTTGFEIDSESDEEGENDENEDKKEEKEDQKEKKEEDEEEKQKQEIIKEKKTKKEKKEKDRKRKENRDKKRTGKSDDNGGFNIDDI